MSSSRIGGERRPKSVVVRSESSLPIAGMVTPCHRACRDPRFRPSSPRSSSVPYPRTTPYVMWVTPGASIARTCSSSRSPTFSSSRSPSPSTIGTTWSSNRSIEPTRYCWMTLAPPPSRTSLSPAPRLVERGPYPIGDEEEGGASVHLQRFARVVREDEDRDVIRRVLSPPALPGRILRPRAGPAPEHV